MCDAPKDGRAILIRGWNYGEENTERHYGLVFWIDNGWQGVDNNVTWRYADSWLPVQQLN